MLEASRAIWMTLPMVNHQTSQWHLTNFLKTAGRTTNVTNSATNGSNLIERSTSLRKEKLANHPTIWINKHFLRVSSHTRCKKDWSLNSSAKLRTQCKASQWCQKEIKHPGKTHREVQLESNHWGLGQSIPRVLVTVKQLTIKSRICLRECSLGYWKSVAKRKRNTLTLRYLAHQQLSLSSCQRKNWS